MSTSTSRLATCSRHIGHKRLRSSSSIVLATSSTNASTALRSTNLEIRPPRASVTDPSQEQQLSDINDESTDDLSDEDYTNHGDASLNAIKRSRPSKRLRQAEDASTTTYRDPQKDSACFFRTLKSSGNNLSTTAPQSEEIPIRGFLTLKTFESKVIYCFSFSQELSPQPSGTYVSRSSNRRDLERSPLQEQATNTYIRYSKFSPEDDKLLRRLKEDACLS